VRVECGNCCSGGKEVDDGNSKTYLKAIKIPDITLRGMINPNGMNFIHCRQVPPVT